MHSITLFYIFYHATKVISQDIRSNPDFIVTEDFVFDRLAYPNIPEQSIEVHIPLNITTVLEGPKRHYQLASTLQNTCDRFFKQTIDQLEPKRTK